MINRKVGVTNNVNSDSNSKVMDVTNNDNTNDDTNIQRRATSVKYTIQASKVLSSLSLLLSRSLLILLNTNNRN